MKNRLIEIHNAMLGIETKGENTLIMADCIKALRQCIMEMDKINNEGMGNENLSVPDSN